MIDNLFAAAAVTAFSDSTCASNTTTTFARAHASDVAAARAALLSSALADLPAWEDNQCLSFGDSCLQLRCFGVSCRKLYARTA